MSYFLSFLKEAVRYKIHESMLRNRFELEDRRNLHREETRAKALERSAIERERRANPKMHTFDIERVGVKLGVVVIAETADTTALIKATELMLPGGEKIVEHALMDGFYFMKSSSGVIIKARLAK